jgi:hypothetical protein
MLILGQLLFAHAVLAAALTVLLAALMRAKQIRKV